MNGSEVGYGRGFDGLPPEVRDRFTGALAGDLNVETLRRALAVAAAGLLREAAGIPSDELAATVARVRPMLAELCRPADTG